MSLTPGTLLVTTDAEPANSHGGTLISSTSGATIAQGLSFAPGILSNCESTALLPNFTFCIAAKDGTAPHIWTTNILTYDVNFTQLSNNASLFTSTSWWIESPIASDFNTTFYVSRVFDPFVGTGSPFNSQIKSVLADGTVGGTTWTLDDETNGVTLRSLGLTADKANFIFSVFDGNVTGGHEIALWNLATNTRGATIVTPDANWNWLEDLYTVPGTQTFLVSGYDLVTKIATVRLYNLSGTLLKEYPFPVSRAGDVTLSRMGLDWSFPTAAFWTRSFQQDTPTILSTFQRIDLATGDLVDNFTVTASETDPTLPTVSCPIIARSAVAPPSLLPVVPWPLTPPFVPGSPTPDGRGFQTVPIRWERIAPHLDSELRNMRINVFQLDMQVGQGTLTGESVNPVVSLEVSSDGGNTYGSARQIPTGAQGAYLTRARALMLGAGRDRVLKTYGSANVPSVIVAAYLDAEAWGS